MILGLDRQSRILIYLQLPPGIFMVLLVEIECIFCCTSHFVARALHCFAMTFLSKPLSCWS